MPLPENTLEWLKLAAIAPALVAAYKLPKVYYWMKTKLVHAFASALMSQIMPTLQEMQLDIGHVKHQVFPNGGGSMNDKLGQVLGNTQRTERSIIVLQATMRAHQDADVNQARFEADADGHFTWVSFAFLRWTGCGIGQVLGHGWSNTLGYADRERVRSEWHAAIEERREFSLLFTMRDASGQDFPVEAFAKPIRCGPNGEIEQWVGVVTRACLPT